MPAERHTAVNVIWNRCVSVQRRVGAVAFSLLALGGTAHAFTSCDADEAASGHLTRRRRSSSAT